MKMDYPEGATPLDPDEMEGLKFRHITTRGELDHLEQANIQDGIAWLSRSREKDILTEVFVCKLHERLFGEVWNWAGSFRRTGKNIGVDPITISVELRILLDDMRYWVEHGTYPELEAAIRFHHRLVFIHPFPNGNGRHARIMADAVLQKIYGKALIDWAGGHDLQAMNERRKDYIAALRAADRSDYDPLFKFAGL
ncbi:mobile mystery protein B [Eilatimonas milleporae]|uniref:Fic-DOC domain mobile mystery protein B n=1 Tax=Eilatimonas milleporae TaxID=911205 RepID=A0A3M0CQE0_9PROT|nr:mobile mystery protein B [Eilatimonas milleporae]RMB09046.1 Fic-DOC domain mobile mystery protein B [Eilatimonas milleporae]